MDAESEVEMPLFSFDETMLFKIPPAVTSRGHCSQEWKPYFAWKGRIEVSMKGQKCKVVFKKPDHSIYGYGFLSKDVEKHIEKCYDSMRFFGIKLMNEKNQSLLMGIGFDDRNVAFDFMQSLQKFQKNAEYDSKSEAPIVTDPSKPKQDYSLKEGEKLVLSFGASSGTTSETLSQAYQYIIPLFTIH